MENDSLKLEKGERKDWRWQMSLHIWPDPGICTKSWQTNLTKSWTKLAYSGHENGTDRQIKWCSKNIHWKKKCAKKWIYWRTFQRSGTPQVLSFEWRRRFISIYYLWTVRTFPRCPRIHLEHWYFIKKWNNVACYQYMIRFEVVWLPKGIDHKNMKKVSFEIFPSTCFYLNLVSLLWPDSTAPTVRNLKVSINIVSFRSGCEARSLWQSRKEHAPVVKVFRRCSII